jgi:hypothetical protein
MAGDITIDLRDGRRVMVDEVVVLERANGRWLRCARDTPSKRMAFPETTSYYHLARDVERIDVTSTGASTEVPSRRTVLRSMQSRSRVGSGKHSRPDWCVSE